MAHHIHTYDSVFQENWPVVSCSDNTLTQYTNVKKTGVLDVADLIKISCKFPVEFPTQTARCAVLQCDATTLTNNINSAYPIINEYVLHIIDEFLKFKKEHGSTVEKELYQDMEVIAFVDRLLKKRAVAFVGEEDNYMLLNKERGISGWESIGTSEETEPLVLKDCLSYSELKISALLSVSSYSQFINNGSRDNCGIVTKNLNEIEQHGVIIGLIGTRLEKEQVMEYEDIVIHKDQNTSSNGYCSGGETTFHKNLRFWSNIYNEQHYLYEDAKEEFDKSIKESKPVRFTKIHDTVLFDNVMYKKRLSLSLDTLLIEANYRAKQADTTAYIHVVGIGLGVWSISPDHQDQVFLDILAQRIQYLLPYLHNVSDLALAYFRSDTCGGFKHQSKIPDNDHPLGGIKINFTKRNPHTKLIGVDESKLLVVSYAWDGNAQPGNEYWMGALSSSGDPAAACSSQIAELHNPHINTANVNGNNLHIASREYGVLHISEYARICLEKSKNV